MRVIYIDADACPVKEEIYRVARRYGWPVKIVANSPMRVPVDVTFELVVQRGFGAADDWIAGQCGPGDIIITADIPLAARGLARDSRVIDAKGKAFTESQIGSALGMRDLMEYLRQGGEIKGGPAPMNAKDRSRFLSRLDETIVAVQKEHPVNKTESQSTE